MHLIHRECYTLWIVRLVKRKERNMSAIEFSTFL